MAEEKKSSRNFVLLVGYLKETTLELKSSSDGRRFIAGNVTVAVDEFNTHRARVLVYEDQLKDKFDAFEKFLPNNVVSIASYLKSNPTATFAVSKSMAAKVWVTGSLEEYVKISGENERSSATITAAKIGSSEPDKFDPRALFEIEGQISSMDDEVVDEVSTGRLLVGLYVPAYKGLIYKLNFVVGAEKNAAKYLKEKYKVGDAMSVKGSLVAMRIQILNDEDSAEAAEDAFGDPITPQYTTRFTREMVITGGNRIDTLFTKKQITDGLVARTSLGQERAKKQKEYLAKQNAEAAEAENSASGNNANDKNDFDF